MTTYSKLHDGTWGLRGENLEPGQVVTVTLKNGTTKQETVDHVVWTGENGLTLATMAKDNNHHSPVVAVEPVVAKKKAKTAKEIDAQPEITEGEAALLSERAMLVGAIDAAIALLQAARPKD